MELSLQPIYTNHIKCHSSIQITLEEDINVPDTKPDIEKIIKERGIIPGKKDILRIRDEVALPKGKPNIDTLLYSELVPQNLQTRITEDGIQLTGDLKCFLLYVPGEEERRLEYLDTELTIDETIPCADCQESAIPDIHFLPQTQEVEPKPDENGENRLLELELTMSMDSCFYQDVEMQILDDAYSTARDLQLTRQPISFEKMLYKNQSTVRVSDRLSIQEEADLILQICASSGTVQIDHQEVQDNGISLEGVILMDILYFTDNDALPLATLKGVVPFQHFMEVKDITPQDHYQLQSDISQISVIMLDSQELEAKVVVDLCAVVFTSVNQDVVDRMEVSELDLEQLQNMPGLVGYIAPCDESLWDIAKEYSTSIENIMALNNLGTDQIRRGDRILLMKQLDGLL